MNKEEFELTVKLTVEQQKQSDIIEKYLLDNHIDIYCRTKRTHIKEWVLNQKKMKLIFCKECTDVVRLTTAMVKSCECGKSSGQYVDHINAWYKGPCMPLGFNNASFSKVLKNPPLTGWGKPFDAFVIEKDCPTFKNQNKDD